MVAAAGLGVHPAAFAPDDGPMRRTVRPRPLSGSNGTWHRRGRPARLTHPLSDRRLCLPVAA
jgi:hypothetical protein